MKKLNILLVLLLILVPLSFIVADGEEGSWPCVFWGTITVNGDITNFNFDAVTAYVVEGENETLADFFYPNATEIPTGNYAIKINNIDSEIIFKINGRDVNQGPKTCLLGTPTELPLTAMITNLQGNFNADEQSNIQDLTLIFGESVQFKQGDNTIISFNHDFSSELNLSAIKINKQDENATSGSIEISGISLPPGQTKTIYIDNKAGEDYVCILDKENAQVSEMTDTCSGSEEIAVSCVGTGTSGYTCTKEDSKLKITGLTHSAVEESSYVPSTPTTTGGGGGGGGVIITTCTENWSCSAWGECVNDIQTRVCTDLNNCETFVSKPATAQGCVAEETQQETGTEGAPVTGGVIGALGTGRTAVLAVILIIIVIGLIIIVSRKKK